jgi:hypothetical protein
MEASDRASSMILRPGRGAIKVVLQHSPRISDSR